MPAPTRKPYLPVDPTHPTKFPEEYGEDIREAILIVEEKWERFFPEIKYFCLNHVPHPIVDGDVDNPVGESEIDGSSEFDFLWGESVDPTMVVSKWKQPHLDEGDTAEAANVEVFADPIPVHAQVRREARENELKKLGFDRLRDLLLTIPLSLLDRAGITCQAGDRFIWDNESFQVEQQERAGYWKNSNLRIYMVLNCEHARMGS